MASNESGSRDPRLSRNDPRLAHKKPVEKPAENKTSDENKKRVASQSPAADLQPSRKITKEDLLKLPRWQPSVGNATTSSDSRRGSAQSNGVSVNANTGNGTVPPKPFFGPPPPPNMAPRPQTAPVANMGGGSVSDDWSVLKNMSANPSFHDWLVAWSEVSGKLGYARTELNKIKPKLDRAQYEYNKMESYFAEWPAIKDMHVKKLERFQRVWNRAQDLVLFLENESEQIKQKLEAAKAAEAAAMPNVFGGISAGVQPTQQPSDNMSRGDFQALKQQVGTLKQLQSKDAAAFKEEIKSEMTTKYGRMDRSFKDLEKQVTALRKELDEVKTAGTGDNEARDVTAKRMDGFAAELEQLQKSFDGLSHTVTELENKEDPNPFGLVQFAPVTGPEQGIHDEDLPAMEQMRADIEAIRIAVDNHKRVLDNLTTEEVVNQMVQVMSQNYFPDARNCQASADKFTALMGQVNERITNVVSRLDQLQNGGAQSDVAQLRTDLDAISTIVHNHKNLVEQSGEKVEDIDTKMKELSAEVGKAQAKLNFLEGKVLT